MKFAQVLEVYLNEDDPKIEGIDNGPYTIQALLKNGSSNQTILATPLNINEKYIPVVGEYVGVQKAPSDFNSGIGFGRTVFYYTSPVALQKNINNNILENAGQLDASGTGGGYAAAGAGISVSTNPSAGDKKNKEFKEVSDLSQLQPFAGDVIFEGRFGQSIRLGYTPKDAKSNQKPTWESSTDESPITIIRNGAGESRGYNKYVIEDIDKDDSSIWLASKQKIRLTSSNNFTLGVTPVQQYQSPQIILNSDRVVINSKKDAVLISGKKSVNISTTGWKSDMDTMFTQIDSMNKELTNLNTQVTTLVGVISTFLPPAGAALSPITAQLGIIGGNLAKITSQLQLMKQ